MQKNEQCAHIFIRCIWTTFVKLFSASLNKLIYKSNLKLDVELSLIVRWVVN